jgi:hypothetical protein
MFGITSRLTSMINDLPDLQKRKRQLDIHTNLAMALMRQVLDRGLDMFFELEDRMAASGLLPDLKTLLARLAPDARGVFSENIEFPFLSIPRSFIG